MTGVLLVAAPLVPDAAGRVVLLVVLLLLRVEGGAVLEVEVEVVVVVVVADLVQLPVALVVDHVVAVPHHHHHHRHHALMQLRWQTCLWRWLHLHHEHGTDRRCHSWHKPSVHRLPDCLVPSLVTGVLVLHWQPVPCQLIAQLTCIV